MRWTKKDLDDVCKTINGIIGKDYYIHCANGYYSLSEKVRNQRGNLADRFHSTQMKAGELGLFLTGFLNGAATILDSQKEEA